MTAEEVFMNHASHATDINSTHFQLNGKRLYKNDLVVPLLRDLVPEKRIIIFLPKQ